jgi:hypothetical protein
VLFEELTQELTTNNGRAELRLALPFAEKADIGLKKIGMEVVRARGDPEATIVLPQALARLPPAGARFEDGALNVHVREGGEWRRTLIRRMDLDALGGALRRLPTTRARRRRRRSPEPLRAPAAWTSGRCSCCSTAVRRGLPRELEEQFTALIREILLTLRALIDWYLERLERRPTEPRVEDIPID